MPITECVPCLIEPDIELVAQSDATANRQMTWIGTDDEDGVVFFPSSPRDDYTLGYCGHWQTGNLQALDRDFNGDGLFEKRSASASRWFLRTTVRSSITSQGDGPSSKSM